MKHRGRPRTAWAPKWKRHPAALASRPQIGCGSILRTKPPRTQDRLGFEPSEARQEIKIPESSPKTCESSSHRAMEVRG